VDHNETLLEIGAVARRLGVTPKVIRTAEAAGRLPKATRLESGRRVWRESDFDRDRPTDIRSVVRAEGEPLTAA